MRNSVAKNRQSITQPVRSHRPMYQIVLYMGLLLLLGLIVMYALRFILHRTNGLRARDQNTFFTLDLRYAFYYFSRARYFICRLRKKPTARIDGFIWED